MQTFEPRIDCFNNEVHGGHSEKIIRQKLWKNHKSFPTIETPLKLYVIDKFDDLFSEAVETLDKCARVGLSCEGKMLGRHGKLEVGTVANMRIVQVTLRPQGYLNTNTTPQSTDL